MVQIAYALPHMREEIAQFMCAAFPKAKWGINEWRGLLDGRWGRDDPYAVTVHDDGQLVGVLGLVSATRRIDGVAHRTMNMTSWYVLKSHRGLGLGGKMLAHITADPTVTVTNFSSAKAAVSVVERAGLKALDSTRLIWRSHGPKPQANGVASVQSLTGLGQHERAIIADHTRLNVQPHLVNTPDGLCLLMLMAKQKHDDYVTYETMHISNKPAFARHAAEIAACVLPAEDAVLSVDKRFVSGAVAAEATETIAVPRFYRPGSLQPCDVDHLYSEIVLLDLKMY